MKKRKKAIFLKNFRGKLQNFQQVSNSYNSKPVEEQMKLTKNQLRRIIIQEMRQMNRRQLNEGLSMGGIKELTDYMATKGMKYSPAGGMAVMTSIGGELIDMVKAGNVEGAAKRFMAAYQAL
jgi:hypothetical protein